MDGNIVSFSQNAMTFFGFYCDFILIKLRLRSHNSTTLFSDPRIFVNFALLLILHLTYFHPFPHVAGNSARCVSPTVALYSSALRHAESRLRNEPLGYLLRVAHFPQTTGAAQTLLDLTLASTEAAISLSVLRCETRAERNQSTEPA